MEYKLISERRNNTTLLEQILFNRGFESIEDIQHFLTVDEDDVLDPTLLDNMLEGTKMLIKHIAANDKAFLIVDSDCDGYCSSAILLNYLNRLFPAWVQNQVKYLMHSGKQHGLSDIDLDALFADGFKLVICPDSASNDYEEHRKLKEYGIDVLVLDHHEAEKVSTYATVINNQLCNYPTKSLCGGAIVYKFCCWIDKLMKTNYANDFRDLVALSLIGDMMDGRDFETHFLIKDGLQRIQNPFFKEMMTRQQYQFQDEITPIGIAFYVVPYMNAMTRSGTLEEKNLLFEAMLEWLSDELIPSTKRGYKGTFETRHEQAGRTCVNVKSRQKKAQDTSLANIEAIIDELGLLDNKILVIPVEAGSVDKNLAGLIANQLAAKYTRPTLILRRIEHEDGSFTYEGSGRNSSRSRLESLRQFCLNTGLVEYAEGHASAFGISIREENLKKFIDKTNELLADFDFTPCYFVDLELNEKQLTDSEVFAIASNNDIWGQGLPEPLIALKDIEITGDNIAFLGSNKRTLKISFPSRRTALIKFNIKEEDKLLLDPNGGRLYITAVGKCALNHYMGNVTPQILLEDFEITRRMKYDF